LKKLTEKAEQDCKYEQTSRWENEVRNVRDFPFSREQYVKSYDERKQRHADRAYARGW
jgi:hypothetical protein